MRFSKIKYDTKEVSLKWTTEKAGETHEHQLTSAQTPHPDFVAALADLVNDVSTICDFPIDYEDGVRVQSVSLSLSEKTGQRGAVITALKSLAIANAPLVLNTPHLVEDGESGVMPHGMPRRLEALQREAAAYLNGKREQTELFGDSGLSSVTFSADGHEPITLTSEQLTRAAEALR